MKRRIFTLLFSMAVAVGAWSQTNQLPLRLAVICDDPTVMNVADVLSVALSQGDQVALLERTEIQKALRELALASASRDPLKLGAMLGADGVLLLERQKQGTNEWLGARLIAVKPGVIIGNARAPWPVTSPGEWAAGVQRHFQALLPKLGVLARDAIPMSVVNLRSALRSAAGEADERELTLLLIERLTRLREVFVLERRRMDLLSTEKEMGRTDESAFWNGSYLVEGVLDRDGYSKEKLTIHASLVPPHGGARVELAIAGGRTELGRVADELARKILQSLNQSAAVAAWQPEEEARNYFEEAQWALKWRMIREAQAAADAAWALGKRDRDCATLRVRAYLAEAQSGGVSYGAGSFRNEAGQPELTDAWLRDLKAKHPRGVAYSRSGNSISYQLRGEDPDGGRLDRIRFVIDLYQNFARTLSPDEPRSRSPWYQLGVEVLESASQYLGHYQSFQAARSGREVELSELRAECRELAAWLSRSKSVRDEYWVGDAVVTHDTLAHTIAEGYNIYRCKVRFGALWQERPEDALAMYRELASSSVFAYLNTGLWSGSADALRSAVWNSADLPRVEPLWQSFISELVNDTNLIRHLEGRFLEVANTPTTAQWTNAFESVLSEIYTNEEAIIGHNVELMYLNWGLSSLVNTCPGGTPDEVRRRFYSEHRPRLETMGRAFWNTSARTADFRRQLQYLREPPPFNMMTFMQAIRPQTYTRSQAAELKPLAVAYRSTLVAQSATNSPAIASQMRGALLTLDRVITAIEATLNPPPPASAPTIPAPPVAVSKPAAPSAVVTNQPKPLTNALQVVRFEKIPWEALGLKALQKPRVFAHRITGDDLLLDLDYEIDAYLGSRGAAALWNLKTKRWRVVAYPTNNTEFFAAHGAGLMNETGVHVELFDGALYLSERTGLFKFDLGRERWETLPIPQAAIFHLRAIDGRLFAGNGESLFEILDGGARITLLASSRRRPAVTQLDNLEALNINAIFPAANGALRVAARGGVYQWGEDDWFKLFSLPEYHSSAEVLGSCVVFRGRAGFNTFDSGGEVRILWPNATNTQPCWTPPPSRSGSSFGMGRPGQVSETPFAKLEPSVANRLGAVPMAVRGSNLFCFVETADATKVERRWQVTDAQGRHAELYVLGSNRPKPIVIPLHFDLTQGPFPSDFTEPREGRPRKNRTWLEFAGDQLLIGQGTTPGLWQLPVAEIEARIHAEDGRLQLAANRLAAEKTETRRRHDANGDGTLQPEEKERALADVAFLRSSLNEYQPRPGWPMTPDNLRWFDANGDHVLQPVEEAAYTNAERFVAQQIIEELDENEDGMLQRSEVMDDISTRAPITSNSFSFADKDHDQMVTEDELTAMFRNSMMQALRQMSFGPGRSPGFARPPGSGGQTFKESVEALWAQPPRGSQPFGWPGGTPPGARAVVPTPRPLTTTTNS